MKLPSQLEFLRHTSAWRTISDWRYLRRMRPRTDFYRTLVGPGQLVFDIGANAGNYTLIFRTIGARVVAVEPQLKLAADLKNRFRRAENIRIVRAALGAKISNGILKKTPALSEVASLHPEIEARSRFASSHSFSEEEVVPVLTLDQLIRDYGTPSFCKIDVEGYEREVLQGLTQPVDLLSIEYNREFWPETSDCLEILAREKIYRFNYTLGDAPSFVSPQWMDANEIKKRLLSIDDPLLWGDIYARRQKPDLAVNSASPRLVSKR